jgi:hypothetical protein
MENLVRYFKNKKRCNKIKSMNDIYNMKIESFYYSKNKKIWYVKTKLFYENRKTWKVFYVLNGLIKKGCLTSKRFESKKEIFKNLPKFLKMVNDFNK